ncbi:MAG: hypothetical protein K2Q32_00890 [Alphaproteobacteria bacterium]|nr:hypothetical protein [Alphaproteobacteria bacterium]
MVVETLAESAVRTEKSTAAAATERTVADLYTKTEMKAGTKSYYTQLLEGWQKNKADIGKGVVDFGKSLGIRAGVFAGIVTAVGAYVYNTRGSPEETLRRPVYDKMDQVNKDALAKSGIKGRINKDDARANAGIAADTTAVDIPAGDKWWGIGDNFKATERDIGGKTYIAISPKTANSRVPVPGSVRLMHSPNDPEVIGARRGNELLIPKDKLKGDEQIKVGKELISHFTPN